MSRATISWDKYARVHGNDFTARIRVMNLLYFNPRQFRTFRATSFFSFTSYAKYERFDCLFSSVIIHRIFLENYWSGFTEKMIDRFYRILSDFGERIVLMNFLNLDFIRMTHPSLSLHLPLSLSLSLIVSLCALIRWIHTANI